MHHQLETRVVDTVGAATSTIINRRPTVVSWITVSAETLNTQGLIQIYNGTDAGSELVWQLEPGYSRHHNFLPHIHCPRGCFIYADAAIASYTVGYMPLSEAPFGECDAE